MTERRREYIRSKKEDFDYDVFIICPVRGVSPEQKTRIEVYVAKLEGQGKRVYYPARDTNQNDESGFQICSDNTLAIYNSVEVHIFFDPNSKGTIFDLGVTFAFGKSLTIVNPEDVLRTENESFNNVLLEWIKRNDLSLE